MKQIKYLGHISNVDGATFHAELKKMLEEQPAHREIELQYQTSMQPNGDIVFSVLVVSRGDI